MPDAMNKVCDHCGATETSAWYGKRPGPYWCKLANCMRAGGYLPPLTGRRSKRQRTADADGGLEDDEPSLAPGQRFPR